MMAQEDQNQKHNCAGVALALNNNKPPSKKLKQKKIPQRGLGVAQLEKIRLDEQKKREAAAAASASASAIFPPSIPTSSTNCSSYSTLSISTHNLTNDSSSLPFPPPEPAGISAPTPPLFRLDPSSIPNTPDIESYVRANGSCGVDTGWPFPIPPTVSRGNVAKMHKFDCGNGLEGECSKLRMELDHGLAIPKLPYDFCAPKWPPLPLIMQSTQQCQQPPQPLPPMVNPPSVSTSPTVNLQAEPPSNQSYYINFKLLTWSDEEKMVGMKRQYPFSLENQQVPSVPSKLATIIHPISGRSDESASCGNGSTFIFEPINPTRQEDPSCSTSVSDRTENSSPKETKENGGLSGEFLTLGPPALASTSLRHPAPPLPSSLSRDFSQFLSQGCNGDPIFQPAADALSQLAPFYSFLPSAESHSDQPGGSKHSCKDDDEDDVDLSLKL